MRKLRTGTPASEEWDKEDVASYLNCDIKTAEKIMGECFRSKNMKRYGFIEKEVLLNFINEKQRIEREREARYNADIAITRQVTALEEQVKSLKEQNISLNKQTAILNEMYHSSSQEARKAYIQSLAANIISAISIAVAIIALVLN